MNNQSINQFIIDVMTYPYFLTSGGIIGFVHRSGFLNVDVHRQLYDALLRESATIPTRNLSRRKRYFGDDDVTIDERNFLESHKYSSQDETGVVRINAA